MWSCVGARQQSQNHSKNAINKMEVFAAWDVPRSPPFHDDSYPSVKQFFRYVFTDRLGQFGEHSNRWVKFREYRWVKFGERQRNLIEAKNWFRKTAAQGDEEALKKLQELTKMGF